MNKLATLQNVLILSSIIFVATGCSTTSKGWPTIGKTGSPLWHAQVSQNEIDIYWSSLSLAELESKWESGVDNKWLRERISRELIKRNLDSLMFMDEDADRLARYARESQRLESQRRKSLINAVEAFEKETRARR